MDRRRRCCLSLMAAGLILQCPACGEAPPAIKDKKPTFAVQGKILVDGQPLADAVVTFHPHGEAGAKVTRSYAKTDASGSFKLSTYEPGDGAPAGRYLVTVYQDPDQPGASLPERYHSPATSGIVAEVKQQDNELEPFRLRCR
jgi:hypothetical protein